MGEKAKKIAWIVFAVVFISFMAVVFAQLLGFGKIAQKQMNGTMSNISSTTLSNYDNTVVTGNEVVSAINNIKTLGGDLKLYVNVETKAGSKETYGYKVTGTGETKKEKFEQYTIKDSSDSKYINPSGSFGSTLLLNANGVTVGIEFVQDASGSKAKTVS